MGEGTGGVDAGETLGYRIYGGGGCGGRLDRWGYLASGRAGLSISPSRRQGMREAMDSIGAGVQPRQWALF